MQLDIYSEIQSRIKDNTAPIDESVNLFSNIIKTKLDIRAVERISFALNFALYVDYHHPGMTAESYIKHPLRVASSVLLNAKVYDPDIIITALIHNVLEVSRISFEGLVSRFGIHIATAVKNLTIDRTQNNTTYLERYYNALHTGWHGSRIVKILDKFDNIFMIGFNPDSRVRASYLDEIEQWIIPMTRNDAPDIADTFTTVAHFMRDEGQLYNDDFVSPPTGHSTL